MTKITDTKKEVEKVEVKAEKEVEKISATVAWKGKERTYTKAIHGEKFLAHADEFALKNGGVVTVV